MSAPSPLDSASSLAPVSNSDGERGAESRGIAPPIAIQPGQQQKARQQLRPRLSPSHFEGRSNFAAFALPASSGEQREESPGQHLERRWRSPRLNKWGERLDSSQACRARAKLKSSTASGAERKAKVIWPGQKSSLTHRKAQPSRLPQARGSVCSTRKAPRRRPKPA